MIDTLDNWVSSTLVDNNLRWNVNATEAMLDTASVLSLDEACKLTISSLPDSIGVKPAICFSGGIDSQTVIDTFLIAGVTPDVVVFNFLDDHNKQDVGHAIKFCESRGITPRLVDFDVIRFLNNRLYDFATKYNISSPQFAVHLYLAGSLRELGYTCAIFGGNNLCQFQDRSWYIPTKEETDWYNYAKEINFPIIGNFWLQDWRLSLMATINMPYFIRNDKPHNYKVKIAGYKNMGYDVIPQDQKYNGFETVKKYYEDMTRDGWTFEKQFRYPISRHISMCMDIPQQIESRINSIKRDFQRNL